MRTLIVEDDPLLGDGLASGLRSLGFAVDWFRDGAAADGALATVAYDAIVLDLSLPGGDGMQWLARWRRQGNSTPVLILTARDALDARVAGLDSGADDYLVKPVELAELAARLRATTRRARGRPEPLWRHGALEFDPAGKRVTWRGQPVELTSREMALLEVLLANSRRVLSKQQLFEKLYAWDHAIESNAIEVYVHHLRRKIDPGIVRTVRGVGYALGAADKGDE
jgi:two-component system response regulator QseB